MSADGLTEIDGQIETNYDTVVYKFDDLNLKPAIVRGIFGYGYEVSIPMASLPTKKTCHPIQY